MVAYYTGAPASTTPSDALGSGRVRSFLHFSKLGPDGAEGRSVTQWQSPTLGKGESLRPFLVPAARVEALLEQVQFIDEPPPWPEGQAAPPAPAPITPAQARAQGTGVGAFFRAYKWPILGGVGVLALGAAWFFTRKK